MKPPLALLHDYLTRSEEFWTGNGLRQHEKVIKSLKRAAAAHDITRDAVVSRVIDLADTRSEQRPPPVYIVNIGGSGSHWLGLMVNEFAGLSDAAEVYVPPSLIETMEKEFSPEEQAIVVDGIHLLHAWARGASPDELPGTRVVNSAHRPEMIATYKRWDPACSVVHLYRDPRDRVLSVTYRKERYRANTDPGVDDESYLRKNARRNVTYLRRYLQKPVHADLELSYDELKADTRSGLRRFLKLVDIEATDPEIDEAIFLHDARNIKAGVVQGQGNLYEGRSNTGIAGASSHDRRLLHHILRFPVDYWGYGIDDCLGRDSVPPTPHTERDLPNPPQGLRIDVSIGGKAWEPLEGNHVVAGAVVRVHPTEGHVDSVSQLVNETVDIVCLAGLEEVTDTTLTSIARLAPLTGLDLSGTSVTADAANSIEQIEVGWVSALDTPLETWANERYLSSAI